eukprot:1155727-Pelagomonas_calceolata.AAC.1
MGQKTRGGQARLVTFVWNGVENKLYAVVEEKYMMDGKSTSWVRNPLAFQKPTYQHTVPLTGREWCLCVALQIPYPSAPSL